MTNKITRTKIQNTKTKMRRAVKKQSKQTARKVTDIRVNNQNSVTNENQSKINFLKSLHSLQMHLSGVDKNLNGYGYKYQDFNEIIREIKNVIKTNNLDIGFVQLPTIKTFGMMVQLMLLQQHFIAQTVAILSHLIHQFIARSNCHLYHQRIKTLCLNLWVHAITYFKRYALVAYLSIESEVDTDASSLEHVQEANGERVSSVDVSPVNSLNKDKDINTKRVTKGETKQPPVSHKSVISLDKLPKRIPAKYHYYKKLLQASKRMHSVLDDAPFDSLEMIDKFLIQLKNDDDSSILKFFETKPELKTIKYWTELINNYLKRTESDPEVIEGFSKFLTYREPKYGQSPLKLFGYIASDNNFGYLCE
ncbi:ERF family protein (plasmid) [Borrelia parkeri]|uniref:ERF family protein n=1 Tax=Borrelia parkeri TaxID=141 RepID=UPI001FF3706E|nr:ERF family protein [Borrelia parkeri]UPA11115.1 ERF family protein [Borrelia parkeri]